MSEKSVEEAIRLYGEGFSLSQIAQRYNVSRQSMHDLLKRRITLRSNVRYGSDNNFYRGGSRAKDIAHNQLEYAVAKGDIVRPEICSVCGTKPKPYKDGRSPIQAHHHDYTKPLDVIWVCKSCHHRIHEEMAGTARRYPK